MSTSTTQRIEAAFAKGKIEMWELFEASVPSFPPSFLPSLLLLYSMRLLSVHRMLLQVNNSCCKDANADPQDAPPLALPVCEA
jgi:hypothetical protein